MRRRLLGRGRSGGSGGGGLSAYYQFEETAGSTTFADSSGNDLTGNIVSINSLEQPGKLGNCFRFNNSELRVPPYELIHLGTKFNSQGVVVEEPFTVSMWLNFTVAPATQWLLEKAFAAGGSGSHSADIGSYISGNLLWFYLNLRQDFNSTTGRRVYCGFTPIINTWYHIAFRLNADGSQNIFINGINQSVTIQNPTAPLAAPDTTKPLRIGRRIDGNPFNGWMDDLAAWKGIALTAQQITDLYNGVSPLSI